MQARSTFERTGYLGPITLLTRTECRRVAAYLRRTDLPPPVVWEKDRAAQERFLYDLATRPSILGPVTALLGPDVALWGVSAVSRAPGQAHPWHSDIESCGADGGFVSVWIGIEKTSRDSSLQLLSGSHRLGRSLQEARASAGIAREMATPEELLALARNENADVELVEPDMGDGEAILFDGRIWHGSDNRRRRGERRALLLQFAAADRPVRIPDWDELDWPFRIRTEPLPPVVVVSGRDRGGVNHVVPPPAPSPRERVTTAVHTLDLQTGDESVEPWRPFPAFRGPTPVVADMSCHASVLQGGHSPHPPHAHEEEELLIPLLGEAELVLAKREDDPAPRTQRITPGSFVYYPAGRYHTIRNPAHSPIAYLMFKWHSPPATATGRVLGTEVVRFDDAPPGPAGDFATRLLLEGPTHDLELLHSHLTVVEPGAGYEPHRDAHDVAIVALEGAIETLGRRVEAPSVVYCSAGELHGLRNAGAEPARYLVFEFHGRARAPRESGPSFASRIASKLRRARARRP